MVAGRESVSVLLIEDSAAEAGLLRDVLIKARRPALRVRCATSLADGLQAARRDPPDAIVLALGLAEPPGLEGLRAVGRAAPEAAVVVYGAAEESIVEAVLAAGAQEYLEPAPAALPRAIRTALARLRAPAHPGLERERRAALAELSTQRELLAGVFEDAPIGMAMTAPDGRYLRVNRAMCEIVGYSEAELLERSWPDITHPDDRLEGRRAVREMLARERGRHHAEKRYVHRDGHAVWVELSATLIRDDDGTPSHFIVQVADISERQAMEEALRQERDHSAAIVAAMGEGYALTIDGRITAVNDALCELTGFARDELIGAGLPWPFWPPSPVESHRAIDERVISLGGDTFIVPMRHRDGTNFEAEVTARPAMKPDGTVLGWVSTIRDVSARRRYEAELERLATHDPLTGLANHRLFHQRLAEEMAGALRHEHPLSVAILDLDHFKQINDRFGHVVGDHTLEAVAERLRTVVREGELLARVGGEEFAWVLPEADAAGAYAAAERARAAVSRHPFDPVGVLTISIGVSTRGTLRDPGALYKRADEALYEAKRGGRNRTVGWNGRSLRVVASPGADG